MGNGRSHNIYIRRQCSQETWVLCEHSLSLWKPVKMPPKDRASTAPQPRTAGRTHRTHVDVLQESKKYLGIQEASGELGGADCEWEQTREQREIGRASCRERVSSPV